MELEINFDTEDLRERLPIEEFADHLQEFTSAHSISLSNLAEICDREKLLSRTSCHRILHGKIDDEYYQQVLVPLEECLTDWMLKRRWIPLQMDLVLNKLFPHRRNRKMIIERTKLPSEVVRFFSLAADPFDVDRVPAENELFSNLELDDVAAQITDAIKYKRFVSVLGPVGAGKTSMKIRVARELEKSGQKFHLIYPEFFDMSLVNVPAIAAAILEEFGLNVPQRSTTRVKRIREHLAQLESKGVRFALVFDECHRLNRKVLSSLKNFWELTNGGFARLLSVVLYGQPQFESTLREVQFREIAERVQLINMPPIQKVAHEYLAHKFHCVGGDVSKLFDAEALRRICYVAKTPLALGNLANIALMEAYKVEEQQVKSGMLTLPDQPEMRRIRKAA